MLKELIENEKVIKFQKQEGDVYDIYIGVANGISGFIRTNENYVMIWYDWYIKHKDTYSLQQIKDLISKHFTVDVIEVEDEEDA